MKELPQPTALERVKALLGEAGYAQAYAPIEALSGLPNTAYWSQDWLDLENERIFARSWIFAGAEAELAEKGAIKPLEIAGTPIFLVRGEDDEVRAFHNVCRHRGTQLIGEACKARAITCPYHAWNYRLDGRLRSRPYFHGPTEVERFEEGDKDLNLLPVRCESWHGCLFVNVSGDAPPLSDWMAPLLARTVNYDFSQMRWIGKTDYTLKTNWKLILENFMEGYHVFAAHPRLIAHAPMEVRWSGEWREHVFYNDYIAPKLTEGRGDGLPHFTGLQEEDLKRGMWFCCFPTFGAEVYADQFVVLVSYPIAPDETREELHFFVAGDEAAASPDHAAGRQELMEMWHDLNLEDVALLERLQRGRRSVAFPGARMSPAWEVPAHQLARQVIEAIVA